VEQNRIFTAARKFCQKDIYFLVQCAIYVNRITLIRTQSYNAENIKNKKASRIIYTEGSEIFYAYTAAKQR